MEGENKRYLLLDGLRGLAIVNMVAFHFLYDVYMVYGRNTGWYGSPAVRFWQQCICWSFILLSGMVWPWGRRHNLRRGLMLNGWGLVISLVTWVAMPGEAVWFGILNFIGCAILLLLPLAPALDRLPPPAGMAGSFALFLLFRHVQRGYLGLGGLRLALPAALYSTPILTPFGFPYPGFSSSDYFPILPWFFLYLTGYFAGRLLDRHGWPAAAHRRVPLLSALGQKSIWVYLIHQPLCMLVCWLLFAAGR